MIFRFCSWCGKKQGHHCHSSRWQYGSVCVDVCDFLIRHALNSSHSSGRVHGRKGWTHLSPAHDLHFGLAAWVMTISIPAPRRLTSYKLSETKPLLLLTYVLTVSMTEIRHPEKKNKLNSSGRLISPFGLFYFFLLPDMCVHFFSWKLGWGEEGAVSLALLLLGISGLYIRNASLCVHVHAASAIFFFSVLT